MVLNSAALFGSPVFLSGGCSGGFGPSVLAGGRDAARLTSAERVLLAPPAETLLDAFGAR